MLAIHKTSLDLLATVLPPDARERCTVFFWDGAIVPAREPSAFGLHLNEPWALREALTPPIDRNTARAIASGEIELSGNLEYAIAALYANLSQVSLRRSLRALTLALRLPSAGSQVVDGVRARLRGRAHSLDRDRAAIGFHYDQPIDFYRAFLDPELVYSCGYFERDGIDLAAAQIAKIDYVLRKAGVRPGDRILDIGCGWGALVIRAAEAFGATALGVTLSESQHAEANRRIAERGLADRVTVELRDYRALDAAPFDAVVSIGMAEHVGRERLADYFAATYRLVRPGGLFVNHAISDQSDGRRKRKADAFIAEYVFPDGELIPIGESLVAAERAGFEVRDVENLREHYHRTLRAWNDRLYAHRDAAMRAGGEPAYRIYRTYLAGSGVGFSKGKLGLHQSVLAKPTAWGAVDIAMTRAHLYR